MGRDLLAQDYLLKQITSSLIYPEDGLGKKFWNTVYQRAWNEYHTTVIPVNTFNKVWIVPDQAFVYESGNSAYILQSHLKVMLEEDYLSLEKHAGINSTPTRGHVPEGYVSPSRLPTPQPSNVEAPQGNNVSTSENVNTLGSQVIREIILPELEKEVNEGKNFANLRQMFSGMILATWYKKALKKSLLGKVYADKAKVKGVDQDPKTNEVIYQRYLKAFKKGVFNYIKEDVDKYTNESIPRKYFSGGFIRDDKSMTVVKKLPVEFIENENTEWSPIIRIMKSGEASSVLDNARVNLNASQARAVPLISIQNNAVAIPIRDMAMRGGDFYKALEIKDLGERLKALKKVRDESIQEKGKLPSRLPGSRRDRDYYSREIADVNAAMAEIERSEESGQLGTDTAMTAKRRAVLVLDDQKDLLGMISSMLSKDYEVVEASNLDEARRLFKENPQKFVGALLDTNIGTDLSYPFADEIKAANIPVVAMTGLITDNEGGWQKRNIPVLEKPFSLAHMKTTIKQYFLAPDAEMTTEESELLQGLKPINRNILTSFKVPNRQEWISALATVMKFFKSQGEAGREGEVLSAKYQEIFSSLMAVVKNFPDSLSNFQEFGLALNDNPVLSQAIAGKSEMLGTFGRVVIADRDTFSNEHRVNQFINEINSPVVQDTAMTAGELNSAKVSIDRAMKGSSQKPVIANLPTQRMPGGIDLNAANMNLQIKRDGRGVPLPLAQQDMARLNSIQGFVPEIIEIRPAVNVPIINELQQKLQSSLPAMANPA
jgi:CheY-like chemotaxis protein